MICNFKKKKERKEKIVISDETKWKNNGKTRGKGAKWWLFRDEMKNTEISLEVSWNQEFGKWRLGLFRGSIGRVSPNGQKLQIKRDSVERAASNGILASCGTRYYSLSLSLSPRPKEVSIDFHWLANPLPGIELSNFSQEWIFSIFPAKQIFETESAKLYRAISNFTFYSHPCFFYFLKQQCHPIFILKILIFLNEIKRRSIRIDKFKYKFLNQV